MLIDMLEDVEDISSIPSIPDMSIVVNVKRAWSFEERVWLQLEE